MKYYKYKNHLINLDQILTIEFRSDKKTIIFRFINTKYIKSVKYENGRIASSEYVDIIASLKISNTIYEPSRT